MPIKVKNETAPSREKPRLLTIDQTAELLAISPKTIRNRLSDKTFPIRPRRFCRRVHFLESDILSMIESLPPAEFSQGRRKKKVVLSLV